MKWCCRNVNKENTKFIYDGQDVLIDDNAGVLTKYQNGLGIDNKLKVTSGGVSKYFLQDHLGSTIGLTNSSGAITEQTAYDSFGNATNNLSTRYQFTGREYDSFTGLQYSRARWYDANLGRFISEDPIGFRGGDINLYGYVKNNPQNWTDPSGNIPRFLLGRYTPVSLDELQLYLALGGLIPGAGEAFDAIDGAISAARGDYTGAALSGMSVVPYFGWGAGITKVCNKADNLVDIAKGSKKLISQFSASTIDDAVGLVMKDPNKVDHLFAAKHNLQPLVNQLGGEENTVRSVLNAANGSLPSSGLFKDIPVAVGGQTILIRGNVIDGVPRLGTMFLR
jgi:RHS repeat-associated protein